jgi:hypothetical protein
MEYLGVWTGTLVFAGTSVYAAFQGLLLRRGTALVAYGNAFAWIAFVTFSMIVCGLLNQREQARRNHRTQKHEIVGQRVSEEAMFHGESRNFAQTFQRLEEEMFPEGI